MWKKRQKSKSALSPPPQDEPGSTSTATSASISETTAPQGSASSMLAPGLSAPPSAYDTGPNSETHPDLSSAAATIATGRALALSPNTPPPSFPTEDTCLAHLRLLTAFNRLKTETGYRDGLWDIWNARAAVAGNAAAATTGDKSNINIIRNGSNGNGNDNNGNDIKATKGKAAENNKTTTTSSSESSSSTDPDPELNDDILVKLREKRWAVYLGRAVDRYAAWWRSFVPDMLLESDMTTVVESEPRPPAETGGSSRQRGHRTRARYEGFPESEPLIWREDMLPPLVWHAHMLNPRLYLEDCLRYGHNALWAGGIPWSAINNAITGTTFDYVVSDACEANWETRTNLAWHNEDDPDAKDVQCPACSTVVSIPWTTCGQPRGYPGAQRQPDIVGQGLAEGHLAHACPSCALTITHESLRAAKFRDDVQASIKSNHAMPGTILDLKTGLPKPLQYDSDNDTSAGCPDRLFPARLARRGLLAHVVGMFKPGGKIPPSMMAVRDAMEENFTGKFADPKNLRKVMNRLGHKKLTDFHVSLDGRRQTRKMMSRYWENSSPFSIDLLNWLHLPTARDIMANLLTKYTCFVEIIAIASSTEDKVAVPTLDVDLAWHTHQLSPQSYLVFTLAKTGAFVDHNDKVDEDRLSTAFEWTSKTYQEKYGEIYSECKCWYCETVRVMALPATKMFGIGKEEKLLEAWHETSKANNVPMPPAAESAHVSSHPAVHTNETTALRTTTRPLRLEFRNRLEETHSKARKRANKTFKADSGKRMGPRGEDKTSFWGKDIAVDGPWASGLAVVTTSAIYPAGPGFVNMGPGVVGSCATGTCGGATGCGSELLGMCSAGCVGSGWFGGKAGCTGMGVGTGGMGGGGF
ncbi:hypothetical protein CORC01_00394 [Colletotrichum orchidophilum]|uniref:Alpha-ketoglutarate-dependent sulfonate dioxygenase n=1 Tax=Colletotrichum orchidophilum TaxID=1209926 RepID=A0A1G4BRY0_9PEZI|nr:uncharacterized protein CORC01_00394 [Colletotrichum orchidophilum]OHF04055.1 hypothetical protein CORC01_00394 [Colletotrichum orchidophilum]